MIVLCDSTYRDQFAITPYVPPLLMHEYVLLCSDHCHIAASVFELVRNAERTCTETCVQSNKSDRQQWIDRLKRALSQVSGMSKVFLMVSEKTGRLNSPQPVNLLEKNMTPGKVLEQIMINLKI